jgi:hypothetical protein
MHLIYASYTKLKRGPSTVHMRVLHTLILFVIWYALICGFFFMFILKTKVKSNQTKLSRKFISCNKKGVKKFFDVATASSIRTARRYHAFKTLFPY